MFSGDMQQAHSVGMHLSVEKTYTSILHPAGDASLTGCTRNVSWHFLPRDASLRDARMRSRRIRLHYQHLTRSRLYAGGTPALPGPAAAKTARKSSALPAKPRGKGGEAALFYAKDVVPVTIVGIIVTGISRRIALAVGADSIAKIAVSVGVARIAIPYLLR